MCGNLLLKSIDFISRRMLDRLNAQYSSVDQEYDMDG